MSVDWGGLRLREGAHYCPEHGQVRPRLGVVPSCPRCGRAVHRCVRLAGAVAMVEPAPLVCAGPDAHTLGPDRVQLGTQACSCAPDGMHRTWTCRVCGDVQRWPPHESAVAPYFGPGSRSST